jgi:VWFA-related protein
MTRHAVLMAAVVALLCGRGGGSPIAHATGQREGQPSYDAATTAILVDVVVRDHRGRPVLDLNQADFEVFEDGVRQKVDTFTRVTRGSGIGIAVKWRNPENTTSIVSDSAADGVSTRTPPVEATTALVFDHLSAEALSLAQNATLLYVPMNGESEVRVGVFATDPGLRIVQAYTTDRAAIREGVKRVLPAGTSAADQTSARRDQLIDRRSELAGQMESAAAGAARGTAALAAIGSQIGSREQELQMIELERSLIDSASALDRETRGYDTSVLLASVVRTLAERPGRKSIVFFSEGLPVSPVLSAKLDYVIDIANSANVTVYAVDARGLRTTSATEAAQREIREYAEERLQQVAAGTTRTNRPISQGLERVQDTVKLDSRTGLARLASDTGGFLANESNDLTSAFRRIDEDNRFHYLLSYSPPNLAFDDKFHAIQVKVRRPGVAVFSRSGYRATRTLRPSDVDTYERPALERLDRTPLPNDFPVRAAGFTFPDPGHPGLTPVIVRFGTGVLEFATDSQRSTYSAQAIVLVRVRNARGEVVHKLSQQYVLSGAAKELEAAKRGDVLFYRQPDLLPGLYTIEAIVFDAIAGRASVRLSTLDVPQSDASDIAMSSLVLVRQSEETAEPPSAGSPAPLFVGRRLLYPNIGEPILKGTGSELPFYFALYGDPAGASATVELLKDGRVIAATPLELPKVAGGRAQHVGKLPIEGLPAGTYQLRIRVTARQRELSRTAFFTLKD